MYWIARRAAVQSPTGRIGQLVDRWREACDRRQRSTQTMMTVSAIFGRLLHFSAVALAPLAFHVGFK